MSKPSSELREKIVEFRSVLGNNRTPGNNPAAIYKIDELANAVAAIDPETGSKAKEIASVARIYYDLDKWKRSRDSPEGMHSKMLNELLGWLETRANILERHNG